MAEYEIASVVWYERDDQIYVTYDHEEPDHMVATRSVASELARDAGLSLVAAPPGICRWVRDQESEASTEEEQLDDGRRKI